MSGVYCYFGITLSGKTTLALEHLKADVARDGRPSLIIDAMPARNLRGYRHEPNRRAVFERLYRDGLHAVYTPKDDEDVDLLYAGVHAAGAEQRTPVHVLHDEAALCQTTQRIPEGMAQALRGWQHNDCTFRLVSQRPADLHGVVFACFPEVYCFRLEREADLERVKKELRLAPDVVERQSQGKFETYSRDRFKRAAHEEKKADEPAAGDPAPAPDGAGAGANRSG